MFYFSQFPIGVKDKVMEYLKYIKSSSFAILSQKSRETRLYFLYYYFIRPQNIEQLTKEIDIIKKN